jgi:hypothetical protein
MKIKLIMSIIFFVMLSLAFTSVGNGANYSDNKLSSLNFVPNSNFIIAGSDSENITSIKLWSELDGQLVKTIPLGEDKTIRSLTVNHSGTEFVFVTRNDNKVDSIESYSLIEDKILWKHKFPKDDFYGIKLAYSDDDRYIISVTSDLMLEFSSDSGKILSTHSEFFNNFHSTPRMAPIDKVLSNNGEYLIIWQQDDSPEFGGWFNDFINWLFQTKKPFNKVMIWDIKRNKLLYEINRPTGPWHSGAAAFSYDNNSFIIGDYNNNFRLYLCNESKIINEWKGMVTDSNIKVTYTPEYFSFSFGNRIYIYQSSDKIFIGEVGSENMVHVFNNILNANEFEDVVFNGKGNLFLMQSRGQLQLYDTNTWKEVWRVNIIGPKTKD